MSIRSGSNGTKDPAAANWDRVFGRKGIHDASLAIPSEDSPVTTGRSGTANLYRGSALPSPRPAMRTTGGVGPQGLIYRCDQCGEVAQRPAGYFPDPPDFISHDCPAHFPRPAELDPEDGA